jgi:hypothetical protein
MDETGFVLAFDDPTYLIQAANDAAAAAAVTAPVNAQPDFNQAGSSNPTAILQGGAAAITSVANAIGTLTAIPGQIRFNQAAQQQAQALALQQLSLQGQLQTLSAKTQLAQAIAAFNKASGVTSSSSLIVILTVAGVVIGALALWKRK